MVILFQKRLTSFSKEGSCGWEQVAIVETKVACGQGLQREYRRTENKDDGLPLPRRDGYRALVRDDVGIDQREARSSVTETTRSKASSRPGTWGCEALVSGSKSQLENRRGQVKVVTSQPRKPEARLVFGV